MVGHTTSSSSHCGAITLPFLGYCNFGSSRLSSVYLVSALLPIFGELLSKNFPSHRCFIRVFFLARWSVALPLYKSASSLPSSSSSSDSASQQAASLPGLVSTKLINILTKQPPLHTKSAEATDFSPLFAAHSITAPLPQ